MDISSHSTPLPNLQGPVTRRLAVAVGALFIAGVMAATAALLGIATHLDEEDVDDVRFYSARAGKPDHRIEELHQQLRLLDDSV